MTNPTRPGGRAPGDLRALRITPDFIKTADGSVLMELGGTRVLCSAQIVPGVPGWRRGSGEGWLTAEYSLLPSSTRERTPREAVRGRQDGRTVEIQRFIGRSLRAVTDMKLLGERTIYIDCDVIEADGGTRCASVCGGYLALHLACKRADRRAGHEEPCRWSTRSRRSAWAWWAANRSWTSSTRRTASPTWT